MQKKTDAEFAWHVAYDAYLLIRRTGLLTESYSIPEELEKSHLRKKINPFYREYTMDKR